MRSTTVRWIILITSLVMGVVIAAQLFWLNKIYNYEQKSFNTSVIKSIQGVYEDLELTSSPHAELRQLVEHPDANTFIFKIDSIPQKEELLENISDNFEDFQVFSDCHVALYETPDNHLLYQGLLRMVTSKQHNSIPDNLPVFKRNYTYIRLYFPYRSQYLLNYMFWWIISAAFLLVVLIGFSLSIFFLYRQKFLNEIQKDFIQNVTHEFQTPLTTLALGLDAIAKPSIHDQPQKFEQYINMLKIQTVYLKQHVENLMSVLKAEAYGLVMQKNNVNPNELIRNALLQLNAIVEEKDARVDLSLEQSNTVIKADGNSLYVAILNLLSNALKYSKQPVITIETKTSNGRYSISVKDNGIGFNEKVKRRIFKKFYRVPTGNVHDVKGLGLGLYFVKKVIKGHKGSITVKSTPGQGSEFIIELP